MFLIFGNYGNNTIALIQWLFEQHVDNVYVAHVETGWANSSWKQHVLRCQQFVKQCHFTPITLYPKATFQKLVHQREYFPNQKYQWCSGFLKGLPFLEWADEMDFACEAVVTLGSRRDDSRARLYLKEFIDESEHYGGRKVWYPLCDYSDQARNDLLDRAGFSLLTHRSLECDPCIHSSLSDLAHLSTDTIQRVVKLETELGQTMFEEKGIVEIVNAAKKQGSDEKRGLENFDMGCGGIFVCGE